LEGQLSELASLCQLSNFLTGSPKADHAAKTDERGCSRENEEQGKVKITEQNRCHHPGSDVGGSGQKFDIELDCSPSGKFEVGTTGESSPGGVRANSRGGAGGG